MKERIRFVRALSSVVGERIADNFDSKVQGLNLYEYRRARRIIDLSIRGIKVKPIPEFLGEGKGAILVSNYPSVFETSKAAIIIGSRLPGDEPRLKVIAREEIITEANLLLKAIGIDKFVFPAQKDETGTYKLQDKLEDILEHLAGSGHVLWLSITGETEGNGLLEENLRTGAAWFAQESQAPIVPMGIITKERKGKKKAAEVVFGEPIIVPKIEGLRWLKNTYLLIDYSKLVSCQIAALLPRGQRGSYEEVEEKLSTINKRIESYG